MTEKKQNRPKHLTYDGVQYLVIAQEYGDGGGRLIVKESAYTTPSGRKEVMVRIQMPGDPSRLSEPQPLQQLLKWIGDAKPLIPREETYAGAEDFKPPTPAPPAP